MTWWFSLKHFIEVCGGSGKVKKAMADRGWVVGPVLDLDSSAFYNLRSLKVLSWILHLLENGLLDALAVEPDPKTLEGTELALRALALIYCCSISAIPSLLEQPRRSKMQEGHMKYGFPHVPMDLPTRRSLSSLPLSLRQRSCIAHAQRITPM